jgi:hypothetical protein
MIINSINEYPKQVAITGDGHFNRDNDFNEHLRDEGITNKTIHVYKDLKSYGEYLSIYIDKMPEDGNKRTLPDIAYVIDLQKFVDPSNPTITKEARKQYLFDKMNIQAPQEETLRFK